MKTTSIYAHKRLSDKMHIILVHEGCSEKKALCGYGSMRPWQLPLDGLFSYDIICQNCIREAKKEARVESQN